MQYIMSATTSPSDRQHQQVSQLYLEYHHWLVGWICRRVTESCDAEDLAQNTFVRILGRDVVPDLHTPRAYLKTIASGLVVNFYRRRDIEAAYLEALAAQPEAETVSPEVIHETMELLVQISLLLDGLPEKAKRAFLMARLDGMRYQAIADELAVSVSSVKKYIFQATRHCLLSTLDGGE